MFYCCCFFSSQASSKYLSLFSLSFIFTLWSAGTTKVYYSDGSLFFNFFFFFFFFFLLAITRSGLLVWIGVICLYLRIPENFVRLILLDSFWLVHVFLLLSLSLLLLLILFKHNYAISHISIQYYVFPQPFCHGQNVTRGQFLNWVKLVWTHFSFF